MIFGQWNGGKSFIRYAYIIVLIVFLETDQTVLVVNTVYAFICRKVTTDFTLIIPIFVNGRAKTSYCQEQVQSKPRRITKTTNKHNTKMNKVSRVRSIFQKGGHLAALTEPI